MLSQTDQFYLEKKEPNKSCLLAMRQIISNHDDNITETIKWGIPCFQYKSKIFCFLAIDRKKNEPYMLMAEGKSLKHPKLEKGNRKRMKILRINPTKDIPIDTIQLILNEAVRVIKF